MTRHDLIEAGAMSLRTMPDDLPPMDRTTHARFIAASVINAVEPLIRTEERDIATSVAAEMMNEAWFALRAKVEESREAFLRVTHTPADHPMARLYDEFLDLIDGRTE